jgi:1,4-alpha-glucan branching enzyme
MSKIRFAAEFPAARRVYIAGDFNGWDPADLRMRRAHKGMDSFVAKVDLEPGKHEYKFVVDGEWVCAPDVPREANSMGSDNHVIEV